MGSIRWRYLLRTGKPDDDVKYFAPWRTKTERSRAARWFWMELAVLFAVQTERGSRHISADQKEFRTPPGGSRGSRPRWRIPFCRILISTPATKMRTDHLEYDGAAHRNGSPSARAMRAETLARRATRSSSSLRSATPVTAIASSIPRFRRLDQDAGFTTDYSEHSAIG